jgi:RNA polymerase sigma-70 factor, ECF subfamily
MDAETPETEDLIERARRGDGSAREELLTRHRSRLRQMVVVHLSSSLTARVDPSDIVQEALAEAHRTLGTYLEARPVLLYPWLRRLAWEYLIQAHRHHLGAERRNPKREYSLDLELPDQSAWRLTDELIDSGTSPSRHLLRDELRAHVRTVLDALSAADRQVLVLRFLEHLSTADTAAVLGLSVAAVKSRQLRALARFRDILQASQADEESS